jgi:hypothetical protein
MDAGGPEGGGIDASGPEAGNCASSGQDCSLLPCCADAGSCMVISFGDSGSQMRCQ